MSKMQSLLNEGWKICMTACCCHSPERLSLISVLLWNLAFLSNRLDLPEDEKTKRYRNG